MTIALILFILFDVALFVWFQKQTYKQLDENPLMEIKISKIEPVLLLLMILAVRIAMTYITSSKDPNDIHHKFMLVVYVLMGIVTISIEFAYISDKLNEIEKFKDKLKKED